MEASSHHEDEDAVGSSQQFSGSGDKAMLCLEVGLMFNEFKEIKEMYSKYGHSKMFPIVIASTTNGRDGIVQFITYACHKSRDWGERTYQSSKALYTIKNIEFCSMPLWIRANGLPQYCLTVENA